MAQLGGQALFLSPRDLQLGRGETVADTARVLSRYVDGIVARTYAHQDLLDLARFASVPVINGLSDDLHPCQALADYFTLREIFGELRGRKLAYVGDGNNMAHSLAFGAAKAGMDIALASPAGVRGEPALPRAGARRRGGGRHRDRGAARPAAAVAGASAVYTDVWASMGQEAEAEKRRRDFAGFTVDAALMARALPDAVFLHCLPCHRGEEVAAEVVDGPQSRVFDQAENRLHVQKALLWLLAHGRTTPSGGDRSTDSNAPSARQDRRQGTGLPPRPQRAAHRPRRRQRPRAPRLLGVAPPRRAAQRGRRLVRLRPGITNGVQVNRRAVKKAPLRSGDRLKIGIFEFDVEGDEVKTAAPVPPPASAAATAAALRLGHLERHDRAPAAPTSRPTTGSTPPRSGARRQAQGARPGLRQQDLRLPDPAGAPAHHLRLGRRGADAGDRHRLRGACRSTAASSCCATRSAGERSASWRASRTGWSTARRPRCRCRRPWSTR